MAFCGVSEFNGDVRRDSRGTTNLVVPQTKPRYNKVCQIEGSSTPWRPLNLEPLTMAVPLREDPPGVFRVGNSRVSLESALHAHQQGESPQAIVEM
jgi:hypothetical protein